MVIRLVTQVPIRQLDILIDSLNPDGILQLTNLLLAERDLLKRFDMGYSTPELRRLEGKVLRGRATQEEISLLQKERKVFLGRLKNGEEIKNQKAIDVIKSITRLMDSKGSLIDRMSHQTDGGRKADIMFLGERLSTINVNPRRFAELVYRDLFNQPVMVMEAIRDMIKLRAHIEAAYIFPDREKLEDELLRRGVYSESDKSQMDLLAELQTDAGRDLTALRTVILDLLTAAKKLDLQFDVEVYKELKSVLPQYHGVNVRWTSWFLVSFVGPHRPYLSPWISNETLLGFYRKGVELTC